MQSKANKNSLVKSFGSIYFYLLLLFIINLIQAYFTPITDDEAYYWMYSKNLDWGFFDHPPMVGIIIKIGSFLFDGILGVRVITTLLMSFTLFLIWRLIPKYYKENNNAPLLYFLLIMSIPVFNMYGFITTPDVPLLFFSSLYLLVFQKFAQEQNILNAILVGVIAALLMYSKYHGGLVILFTLVANIHVLKKIYFYLSGFIGIALFLPHILWQIDHEFVTFNYHLVQRSDNQLQFKNILEYFLNVLIVLNPALLIFLIYKWFKKELLEIDKTNKWLFVGVICVFTITSLKGHVEPHWVAINAIPLLIILFKLTQKTSRNRKLLKNIALFSFVLIICTRIAINLPLLKVQGINVYGNEYYSLIKSQSHGEKVVFANSYQRAALYSFYTGDSAFSYNCTSYRKNQYDIWNYEDSYHNQPVYLVGNWPSSFYDSLYSPSGELIWNKHVEKFPMVNKLSIEMSSPLEKLILDSIQPIHFTIHNPYDHKIIFDDETMPLRLGVYLTSNQTQEKINVPLVNFPEIEAYAKTEANGSLDIKNIPTGSYKMVFVIKPGYLYDIYISKPYEVVIE